MVFQKLAFSEALAQGVLMVKRGDQALGEQDLAALLVSDIETADICLFDAPLRVVRRGYDHVLGFLNEKELQLVREHQFGIGYVWRGCSVGAPVSPRQPCFPRSNALEFIQEVYGGELMGLNSEGKIILD